MTSAYQLYFSPGACSRVSIAALEWVGADYALCPVLLADNQQRQPAYKALNPKEQVPLLVTPEGTLTETVAIALYLHQVYPQAVLLPAASPYDTAIATSWLVWCSSMLHPLIFRARRAGRVHPEAAAHEGIQQVAIEGLTTQFQLAERALSDGRQWLCGSSCSLADLYLLWCFQRAAQSGCEIGNWQALGAWQARAESQPAWARMLQREAQAMSVIEKGASA
ncbi:glutathione S-transferase [Stutzerimonas stutzeri]|uniref:Glutathione S-transferase n=1 Tax=Stutzerimonas stutzeri TaxID=316 RepID=W8R7M5_STUST|nr:glutathione S-transferase family protein [Stutzerimonas stutzeri]AHL74342.1 glutathione S-transferase [Stutzerimonas stutzeri]MCQ4330831.1 glutathione S-transferase family protein [Stutzerimonas stutzeri]